MRQSEFGEYDVSALPSQHNDLANYIGPLEIRMTATSGRGLFVTSAVRAGTMLLVEKAMVCAFKAEKVVFTRFIDHTDPSAVVETATQGHCKQLAITLASQSKLHNYRLSVLQCGLVAPNSVVPHMSLYRTDDEDLVAEANKGFRSAPALTAAQVGDICLFPQQQLMHFNAQIGAIVSRNSYSIGEQDNEDVEQESEEEGEADRAGTGTGLWALASFMNRVSPQSVSTVRCNIGDVMMVFSKRDLRAGEELTTTQHGELSAEEKRQLARKWDIRL